LRRIIARTTTENALTAEGDLMTADEFRQMALELPETAEVGHMGHPDFRVRNKIFATLYYPTDEWGMVKLTPDDQRHFVRLDPKVFTPVKGGWGKRGATSVRLAEATDDTLRPALVAAWRNVAPKRLVEDFDSAE
jgi:hypothetical protein